MTSFYLGSSAHSTGAMNHQATTFIGVDLAWRTGKNHSGVVVARGNSAGAEIILCSSGLYTLSEILAFILQMSTDNTVIAVDAPLILKNQHGRRPCETQISQKFGSRHASTHSTNLTLYPQADSLRFAETLLDHGFSLDVDPLSDKKRGGRWFFEIYTHAAIVVLFDLPRIVKYKKGRVADRRHGLGELRDLLWQKLRFAEPALLENAAFRHLAHQDLRPVKGKALKKYEDTLDALLCAYLALFYWYWAGEKNEIFGDRQSGLIVNPTQSV